MLIAVQDSNFDRIRRGEQVVGKTTGNLDIINEEFKMTAFEEFNYQERLKNIKKQKDLDIENALFANRSKDLDTLYALNRVPAAIPNSQDSSFLHYTSGLCTFEESIAAKTIKAEVFVKKIKDDKKAFQKKIRQIEQSLEEKEAKESELFKKKEEEEEEERQRERKRYLEEHIKELQIRSEVRLKQNAQWAEDYKVYLGKTPMFKEIERKFARSFVIPELEERKKKLQEIRDLHKPIGRQDIMEHENKVQKMLEDINMEKKIQLENSKWMYSKPGFESRHHKLVADEMAKIRRQPQEEQLEKVKRREKMWELWSEVKEKYSPKVDPKKEMELLAIIEKLKKKENRPKTLEGDEMIDPRKLGGEYLKSVKEMVQKKLKDNPKPKEVDLSKETSNEPGKKQMGTSMTSEGTVVKRKNYLVELRKDNKLQASKDPLEIIIQNKSLDYKDRKELLQSQIEKYEEKARRKEMAKKFKVRRNTEGEANTLDNDDDEVDRLYINSIKAKLQMLGH